MGKFFFRSPFYKKGSSSSTFWVTCFGNFFEHYDSALYSCLCSFLAHVISPSTTPAQALVKAYAIIPLGMMARPLGALFFGVIGDLYGRAKALQITLCGMACVSFCFALSPSLPLFSSYAFLIFAIGRLCQNFFSAGETIGGAIYLLEQEKGKKDDLVSSFYGASSIGGILLASFLASLLGSYGFLQKGWPYLYLIGCTTALFALLMRRSSALQSAPRRSFQLLEHLTVFWTYRKSLAIIALVSGFSYANYSIAMIVSSGLMPLISCVKIEEMMQLNTLLLILDFILLPFFGFIATKISREKVMLFASIAAALFSIPLFFFLEGASLYMIALIRVAFVFIGTAFAAPFHAFIQQMLPKEHRYSIISFGYALGCQLLGSLTASVSLWLFDLTKMPLSAGLYWMLLAVGSSMAVLSVLLKKKKESVVLSLN